MVKGRKAKRAGLPSPSRGAARDGLRSVRGSGATTSKGVGPAKPKGFVQALLEHGGEAAVLLDTRGRICGFSPAAERLFRRAAAETIGADVAVLMPSRSRQAPAASEDADLPRLPSRWMKLPGLRARGRDVLGRSGDGRTIALHVRAIDLTIERKRRVLLLLRDASDRMALEARLRRAEERLRRSEETLANAQRMTQTGVWRWDAAGDREEWSSELLALLGLDPRSATPDFDLYLAQIHPEDRERISRAHDASFESGTPHTLEYRIVRPDGETRNILEQAEYIRDARGRVIWQHGTLQDITERKREEAMLVRAKEAAEIANLAKTRFLANMSHELRTPLNAIIGFSEIMASETLGPLGVPRYAGYAGDILESGRHLLGVINDILDMSRIEAGAVQLEESEVDLDVVAEAALRLVAHRAADLGLRLGKDLPAGLPAVRGDERLLRQVLINLLSNAVKFTPAGGWVKLGARVGPDGGVALTVADSGIGIAPENIAKALEPFGQVDTSLSRKYEGSGLGLPLVKSIVELHGGTIAIDSALDCGTTVTLRLPPARSVARPAQPKSRQTSPRRARAKSAWSADQ